MPNLADRPAGLSAEQYNNARVIAQVGRSLGASNRDVLVALMAAWQESGLRNLNYGDRDSIGLFQQRNAWGSRSARLDPRQSARMFFQGGNDGQRGLLDFKQRNSWSLTRAAQKVQVSAFPNAYAKHESKAREVLATLGGGSVDEVVNPNSTPLMEGGKELIEEGPLGLDEQVQAAAPQNMGMPMGVAAATAPGIETADVMPEFEMPSLNFLEPGTSEGGAAGGGAKFGDVFPQGNTVGGARGRVASLVNSVLGTPYVWGGNDPDKGLDCSGFTKYVLGQLGVNLPRISNQQARFGKRVGLNQLQVGDLVAIDNSSRNNGADHVAIWLGGGRIAEAPRPGLSVRIRTIDDDEKGWYGVALDY